MYLLIAGGGKVGSNLARGLIRGNHEVTLIEQRRDKFDQLELEFEHQVHKGDATELFVLERAGIKRPPDIVVAVTGDDEDNIIICQLARERYGVERVIARINDPRNQSYFDLLGVSPTVSATGAIMGLIEHEVPEHGALKLPEGARIISVVHQGTAEIPDDQTELQGGDQVLAILEPGKEDELRRC